MGLTPVEGRRGSRRGEREKRLKLHPTPLEALELEWSFRWQGLYTQSTIGYRTSQVGLWY